MIKEGPVQVFVLRHRSESGISTCVIAPPWGASVIAFSYHDARLMWPTPVLEATDLATFASKPTSYGMPILGPTPGRVGKNQSGQLNYEGKSYQLAPTRHGVLRDREWAVSSSSESSILCSTEVHPGDGKPGSYPFPFKAEHEVIVSQARLESRVRLRNLANHPIPLDAGWHPYLARSGDCIVTVPAKRYWELDGCQEPTPTGDRLPAKGRYDFRSGQRLTKPDYFDDIFTDLPHGEVVSKVEEMSDVLLSRGEFSKARIRRRVVLPVPDGDDCEQIRHVQLYTPSGRNAICIEPLSAPPNAINKKLGFHNVEPNGVVEFRLFLEIDIDL